MSEPTPPHAAPQPQPGPQQPPQAWQQPAQQQWMPPAGPFAVVPLKPTAVTVMLVLESVATAFSVLLIVAIVALSSSQGTPPPVAFTIAFCVIGAMMVLRVGSLVLVRLGMGWPRWAYVGLVAVGTIAAGGLAPVPLVLILLILAIVTIVQLFRRPTTAWLRWRASGAQPTPPSASGPFAAA